MDFILNGQGVGSVASTLMQNNFDPNALRPYVGRDGKTYITANVFNPQKGVMEPTAVPIGNAAATLRYEDWRLIDSAAVKAAKPRLRLVADLRAGGLEYNIPNGMGKTVLSTETQSDVTGAVVSMDGLRKSENDRPEFEMTNTPLPIIHKDFHFSARQVMVSRNGGSPLDLSTAELAARRVAEEAEKMAIGIGGTYLYGGGNIYGLTNFPKRQTKVLTNPTSSGWTPAKLITEVLAMIELARLQNHFGPFMLYAGAAWSPYLDSDYILTGGNVATQTLRERLKKIEQIADLKTLDYLTGYQLVLVQWTSDVMREIVGMDIVTVQWESQGGMQLNFKVMAILVPQPRADFSGQCGIVHGNTA